MDPNDTKILLYKRVVSEYNIAWQKWTKRTDRGSDKSMNFKDWGTREDSEKFTDYAEYGSVDYLAYIYMMDKTKNFHLNIIQDPAPKDPVVEDGTFNVDKDGKTKGERPQLTEPKKV